MSTLTPRPEYREIELHLIDPPALAVRQSFDSDKLNELADDIRANGLLQPLGVKRAGDRFEVIYGHRRRVACELVGVLVVPCFIWPESNVSPEALKIKENKYREDINPGDEAEYLQELLTKECGDDTDALAALVGESREYVEGRLNLLRGDPRVLAALRADENPITFSVARELNAIKDPQQRFYYLDAARRGGVSAKVARQWRIDANTFTDRQTDAGAPPPQTAQASIVSGLSPYRCFVCGRDDEMYNMDLVYIHRFERETIERMLAPPAPAPGAAAPEGKG